MDYQKRVQATTLRPGDILLLIFMTEFGRFACQPFPTGRHADSEESFFIKLFTH